jgi:hypothetical protein
MEIPICDQHINSSEKMRPAGDIRGVDPTSDRFSFLLRGAFACTRGDCGRYYHFAQGYFFLADRISETINYRLCYKHGDQLLPSMAIVERDGDKCDEYTFECPICGAREGGALRLPLK